jgi:hypothetical protein
LPCPCLLREGNSFIVAARCHSDDAPTSLVNRGDSYGGGDGYGYGYGYDDDGYDGDSYGNGYDDDSYDRDGYSLVRRYVFIFTVECCLIKHFLINRGGGDGYSYGDGSYGGHDGYSGDDGYGYTGGDGYGEDDSYGDGGYDGDSYDDDSYKVKKR